jgi:hypothetical protein
MGDLKLSPDLRQPAGEIGHRRGDQGHDGADQDRGSQHHQRRG